MFNASHWSVAVPPARRVLFKHVILSRFNNTDWSKHAGSVLPWMVFVKLPLWCVSQLSGAPPPYVRQIILQQRRAFQQNALICQVLFEDAILGSVVVGEFCVLFYVLLDKIPLIPGTLAPDSVQLPGKCCFLHCFPS